MKVYTYFDSNFVSRDARKILALWEQCWQRAGWEPVVLDSNTAKQHPRYQSVVDRVRQFPTVNKPQYEMACYVRWLAMAQVGGLHSDWDMVNLGEPPWELGNKFTDWGRWGGFMPVLVSGNRADFESVLDWFFLDPPIEQQGKRQHCSDMLFFTTYGPQFMQAANPAKACDLLGEGPEKIVHASNGECLGMMKQHKVDVIRKLVSGKVPLSLMRKRHRHLVPWRKFEN